MKLADLLPLRVRSLWRACSHSFGLRRPFAEAVPVRRCSCLRRERWSRSTHPSRDPAHQGQTALSRINRGRGLVQRTAGRFFVQWLVHEIEEARAEVDRAPQDDALADAHHGIPAPVRGRVKEVVVCLLERRKHHRGGLQLLDPVPRHPVHGTHGGHRVCDGCV